MREDFKNVILSQSLKSEMNLEVAFETYNNWKNILDTIVLNFFDVLKEPLETELSRLSGTWSFELRQPLNRKSLLNIHLSNTNWEGLEFGIGDYDGDRVHFFVQYNTEVRMLLYSFITDRLGGRANLDIWFQRMDEPYNRWDNKLEGIIAIYKPDEFMEYTINKLLKLASIIEEFFSNAANQL